MEKGIFNEREKAMEANYFRQEDARLLEQLRKKAPLDDIAAALRDKLHLDNPDLLQRVREAGISAETAAAFLVAPLVQVAWADGFAGKPEHDAVLRLARARGVEAGSPAYAQLEEWLKTRPSDALFDTAIEVIKYGFSVLPPAEQRERIHAIVDACQEVASASGKGLAPLLGLGSTVSRTEASMLDDIQNQLRSRA
jgi:hypothetical protein